MLKNISISIKLYLLVAVALVALAIFGVTAFSTVRLVMVNGSVYARIVQGKDLIADILPPPAYIIESKLTLLELIQAKDTAQRKTLLDRMARLEKEYNDRREFWTANLVEGEMKNTLLTAAHQPAAEFYRTFNDKVKPLIEAGKLSDADAIAQGEVERLYVSHRAAIDKVVEMAGEFAKQNEAQAAQVTAARTVLLTGMGLGCAVMTLVLATLVIRSMTRPLHELMGVMKDVAEGEGDLMKRLNIDRRDEIGLLAGFIDAVLNNIHDIVKEVTATTREVAAGSTQIAASAEQLAQGMRQQQGQTQQVSAAIEEMSASVVEVAKKSVEATTAASASGQQAREGGGLVERTVLEMKGIADDVNESAKAVGSLGRKSEQIGQIIGVINDIADQTNLLALNAAIEAARAGEHGRGFAVVADEVRKLAERTTQATKQVAGSIREIQTETGAAVERIDGGAKRVTTGVELAGSAGKSLSQIVAGSQTLQQMVQSIAAAAEQQSAASGEIARSIEQINAVTAESTEAASQSATAAAQLSQRAEKLQMLVSKFRVNRRERNQGPPVGLNDRRESERPGQGDHGASRTRRGTTAQRAPHTQRA